ncbi:GntR family transcriptional regulator [Streptomyces sp. NPDC059611]|uniref:GntR family transcriptional regulator n=1 Tax=Streptomyces sp. NPDC059611 TaxID=3346884 RepID=UPI00369AB0E4
MTDHDNSRAPFAEQAAVRDVHDRITSGYYVPGSKLTLRELSASTGHDSSVLREVLDHLTTTTGLVTRVNKGWRIADPRPGYRAERARGVLSGMIARGAWPAGTVLPARLVLGRLLLTEPAHLTQALGALADEGVLRMEPKGPPTVLPAPAGSPARDPWPPGEKEVLDALPSKTLPGAAHDADSLHLVAHAVRERYKDGVCLPSEAMTMQESRQAETVHRLVIRAFTHTSGHATTHFLAVRSTAAQVMACHALPSNGPLYERLYRITVLATTLAHLADALAKPGPRHVPTCAPRAWPIHAPEGP